MTEQITLNTTPAKYERYFPNPMFASPDGLRSSEPGDIVQAVYMADGHYFAKDAVWGYIPSRRTSLENPITYTDGATITRKGAVSSAFRNWRCIIPASSFVCLREVDGQMMRYRLSRRDGGLMLFAGIMEPNPLRIGGREAAVALITTTPNRMLDPHGLHAPLVLERKQLEPWLHPRTSMAEVKTFIRPPADFSLKLTIYPEPATEPALA